MVVVGGGIRKVSSESCHGIADRASYDAHQGISAHDRQPLDVVALHHLHQLIQRKLLRDGEQFARGHDFADLATVLLHEVEGGLSGSPEKVEPSNVRALGADLAATNKIAFRDYSDQPIVLIDYREAADADGSMTRTVVTSRVMI